MLKFNENGQFKILIIADAQDTDYPQKETQDIIRNSLKTAKPDLVIFLGDNIAGDFDGVTPKRTKDAVAKLLEPICEQDIPFALVFGNHDHEGLMNKCGFTEMQAKEFILEEFMSYKNCLAVKGEPKCSASTYNLTIKASKSDKDIFNLWLFDSQAYAKEGGYGYVLPEQTEWYIKTSEKLKAENGGNPLPSFLFQHIPVPEVYRLAKRIPIYLPNCFWGQSKLYRSFFMPKNIRQGKFREGPCCANVRHNQFESWKKQGDILCAFFGHDHPNDYLGTVDGIDLCAVPAAGYYSYGHHHGARTVTIFENDIKNYRTEILTEEKLLSYPVLPKYKQRHGYYEYMKKKNK